MSTSGPLRPRNFFLNEQHELARGQKDGGGRSAQYATINWTAKGSRLSDSLAQTKRVMERSPDPMKDRHFFMTALPTPFVTKRSTNKKKAPDGTFEERTRYAGEHSRVFRRLGMDLIDVDDDGIAIVHATKERFERLVTTASDLEREGTRERARWITLDRFAPVSSDRRVDTDWLHSLRKSVLVDVVVELQPLLARIETDEVMRAISQGLNRSAEETLTGNGSDFSGRRWFRGRMRRKTLEQIAESYFSVQSLHPPHLTPVSARQRASKLKAVDKPKKVKSTVDVASLPAIAVVDTGVPTGHVHLAAYSRGTYRHPDAPGSYAGDHGSLVASRVVFGDVEDASEGLPPATCRFVDVMVASDKDRIEDKAVAPALDAVVGIYPDVRVFNCSFGELRPLAAYGVVERAERLALVRDLDNFIFARDVIVVVAAGNTPPGLVPPEQYPFHIDNPEWQLGAWPSGTNSLTCGSLVGALDDDCIVNTLGWPSPFSRIGPGVAGSPVPEYAANGGNLDSSWTFRPGLGVWACTADGMLEDRLGTSLAAPLLSREAAFALQLRQRYCATGGRPFGVTAKALLALCASRVEMPAPVRALADRTIGRGTTTSECLKKVKTTSALFVWQGMIEGPDDVVRVQVPVPLAWLDEAERPTLRLVCSWDPPVNDAVHDIWTCRRVTATLRTEPAAKALRGSQGTHQSYPLIDRKYDLSASKLEKLGIVPETDLWTIELAYEQIAEYWVGMTFAPQQRVAFVIELRDEAAKPVSPQRAVQSLPIAATMDRLAVPPIHAPTPVVLPRS